MKLKICGMKYDSNIKEVLNLRPNYIGFIFWKNSHRYVTNTSIPNKIIKTGVFVDSPLDKIISIVKNHNLRLFSFIERKSRTLFKFKNKLKC